MTTTAIPSVGGKLSYSLDNVHFTQLAQVRKFQGPQSKQTIVDQTNLLTAGNGDGPLAVRYSTGDAQMDGIVSPQDSSQLTLGQLHANLTLVYWQLLESDGISLWSWQGYVSEFKPFDLDVNKAVVFTAKIRVWGALTGPLGTA